jgi:hypothetical protein
VEALTAAVAGHGWMDVSFEDAARECCVMHSGLSDFRVSQRRCGEKQRARRPDAIGGPTHLWLAGRTLRCHGGPVDEHDERL